MTTQRTIQIFLGFTALTVLVLGLVLANSDDRNTENLGGVDGVLGGEFTLHHAKGSASLSDFKGQVVVLYFGFLNCPEVCPTSMSMITKALNKLDAEELEQVQPILVSIDPERDSYDQIKEFTAYFHPQILGVTGSRDEIDLVASEYGAFNEVIDSTTDGSDYEFRHSSRYYVVDQNGELVDAMRHSTTANELVARIRTLI